MNLRRNINVFYRIYAKAGLLIIIHIALLSDVYSQEDKSAPPPLRERLFFGGNFGLQFGTITDIEVSPVIGLWVLPRLGVAAGPDFRFYKDPIDRTTIYGGRIYTQFIFLQDLNSIIPLGVHTGLFLHGEYEVLSLESSFWKFPPYVSERFTTGTMLAGGGLSQQIGRRSSLNLMILWALNDSQYNLYGSPEIRVGFTF